MLKSQLFQRVEISEHDRMREDLAAVLSLMPEPLVTIARRVPTLLSSNKHSAQEALDRLRGEFPDVHVDRILPVLLWFGRNATIFPFSDDSSKSWVEDMAELGIVSSDQQRNCLEMVDRIRSEFSAEDAKSRLSRGRAEDGLLPRFVDADVTVELRAVFHDNF